MHMPETVFFFSQLPAPVKAMALKDFSRSAAAAGTSAVGDPRTALFDRSVSQVRATHLGRSKYLGGSYGAQLAAEISFERIRCAFCAAPKGYAIGTILAV
jgi:hypothetical protein